MTTPFDAVKFAAGLRDFVERAVRPLAEHVAALEQQQVKTLADSYKGTHLPGHYERGSLVTHRGGLWLCVAAGDGTPGNSANWKLIVKGGRE